MAKECAICGKGSMMVQRRVKLRGRYNPTTKRRQYPNLHWATSTSGKRIRACSKCLKALNKKRVNLENK